MRIHGAGWALAWLLWRRNRRWLAALGVYLVALAAASQLVGEDLASRAVVLQVSLAALLALIWLFGEFAFSSGADLLDRQSGFPSRMFVLPVKTRALVGWPMLLGALCAGVYWMFLALAIWRPLGFQAPRFWPAAYLASLVAVVQALCWTSFPSPWLRIALAVVHASASLALAHWALQRGVAEGVVAMALLAQLPIVFGAGLRGVSRARQSVLPAAWSLAGRPRRAAARRVPQFQSARDAQLWFESQLNGRALPMISVFIGLALVASSWAVGENGSAALRFTMGLFYLPLFGCVTCGITMARFRQSQEVRPMPYFMATRPLGTADLVAAKLRVAAHSVLACYAMMLAAAATSLLLTSAGPAALAMVWGMLAEHSSTKVAALAAYLALALPMIAWLLIANSLWSGLSGRAWVGVVYGMVNGLLPVPALLIWLRMQAEPDIALQWMPRLVWFINGLAALKLSAVAVAGITAVRRGLLRWRWLGIGVVLWLALFVMTISIVGWWIAPSALTWRWFPGAVLLALPGLGLVLAIPALTWNRRTL